MSELESRSRPIQRLTGFEVGGQSGETGADVAHSSRIRTTTTGTIVKASDGDVEMGEDKKAVQPLPIPGSLEQRVSTGSDTVAASTQSPSDLPTPPDALLLSTCSDGNKSVGSVAAGVKLPSLHSSILGPRMTSTSSHTSSGPTSVSPSHWSPGRSSDPHLYSISSQHYIYSSVKPYLSTSFQTSAERGGASGSNKQLESRNAMDEDDEEDVFGNTSQALGLLSAGEPSPPQLRRSNDMEREEGDASGVFSFSSPCFGPKSLEASDIPPLSPPPSDPHKRSQRLMSPSWTAATFGKLSLNGAGPDSSTSRRTPVGQTARPSSNLSDAHMSTIHSRSLPSNAGIAISAQNRKLSFNRRPPPHNGTKSYHLAGGGGGGSSGVMLHPHSPFHRAAPGPRSRSTSRNRLGENGSTPRSTMRQALVDLDDDETDEESMVMDGDQEMEDDDATEDEADQRSNRFKGPTSSGQQHSYPPHQHTPHQPQQQHQGKMYEHTPARSIGSPSVTLHRHASGQATTMSASFERANSGLSRQYTSDRYASGAGGSHGSHYAMGRHHPYAVSPAGVSPSNAGVLSSYSPSNTRVGMARRRSSIGNGITPNGTVAASPQQTNHQLSHSPRYLATTRPGGPVYYEQQYHPHAGHAYQSHQLGESPEHNTVRRTSYAPSSGLNRQRGQTGEEDEEEDEEEEEGEGEEEQGEEPDEQEDSREKAVKKKSATRQTRAASHSRAPPSSLTGGGEVESSEMNEVSAIRERLGGAANCSAFISKLWYLMCRPELYAKYIHWSESGDSVILSNDPDVNNEFASEVLPKLFKHGNNASFVRQLNLYGFQRVPSSRLLDAAETKAAKQFSSNISTALQLYGPHSSFAHPRFKKDQEALLPSMKPRSSKKTKKAGQTGGNGARGAESEGEEEYGI